MTGIGWSRIRGKDAVPIITAGLPALSSRHQAAVAALCKGDLVEPDIVPKEVYRWLASRPGESVVLVPPKAAKRIERRSVTALSLAVCRCCGKSYILKRADSPKDCCYESRCRKWLDARRHKVAYRKDPVLRTRKIKAVQRARQARQDTV